MKFVSRFAAALIAGVALVGAVGAVTGSGKVAAADVNKDRALSKSEACAGKTPRICRNFVAIDANKDGVVTRAEVRAFRDAKRVAKGRQPAPARP